MASSSSVFDDQTDEDFFDKLVDDEFGVAASSPGTGDMTRALSNMSIGDVGSSADNSKDIFEVEEHHESLTAGQAVTATEKEVFVLEEADRLVSSDSFSFDKVVPLCDQHNEVVTGELESPGSQNQKKSSFKVVQWSAFDTVKEEPDLSGFGSYSEFFPENLGGSSEKVCSNQQGRSVVNNATDLGSNFGGLGQNEAQVYMEAFEHNSSSSLLQQQDYQQVADNDPQYQENLYPGWKYDYTIGQWLPVDGNDLTCNTQITGYGNSVMNPEGAFHDKVQLATNEVVQGQISDFSYLQQSAQPTVQTIADGSGSISNLAEVSRETAEYPPNMLFDPQYPDWYYDTNSQQWCSLESYSQSMQMTTDVSQYQSTNEENTASGSYFSEQKSNSYDTGTNQFENQATNLEHSGQWDGSSSSFSQHFIRQPETANNGVASTGSSGIHLTENFYGSESLNGNYIERGVGFEPMKSFSNQGYGHDNRATALQGFVPDKSQNPFNPAKVEQSQHTYVPNNYYGDQNIGSYTQQSLDTGIYSNFAPLNDFNQGRSSAGRPPHALVTFGFGGKLIVMKDTPYGANLMKGSQNTGSGSIFILNLVDVVIANSDSMHFKPSSMDYFHSLCKQSFPGPLVGGNAASKDLYKWIDERIASCESSSMDFRQGALLKVLLSLLKISCQYYGKLRSPFGIDPSSLQADGPELAVTKLFASVRKNDTHLREYGALTHCMNNLPNEGQIQMAALEVQRLLINGKRKEALQFAQEGLLWGPALVLAAQLGDKFYVDTVKKMAHRQFVSGSPLRTLCLLIAGQPADVFTADNSNYTLSASNIPQQTSQPLANGMLDDWEENLAIITANRTKDDELVIVHLGDSLWKERGEVSAAHTCYLVAEANFESHSDSARLCLVGADHWKCPRTYACPEAIQRTEIYEYSKVLGNSQFLLLPFQPYKLVYAHMLAEVGKVSDSLRYCQAISKTLKNSGRSAEVEMWKVVASSLEERIRMHQEGGYSTNLAPAKLVGKLFTSIDKSIHRMIGAPPPLPSMPENKVQNSDYENFSMAPKVAGSQSTMSMSSLMPSASVERISEWTSDNKKNMPNRSVSEPDFGRSPQQEQLNPSSNSSPTDVQRKTLNSGGSRFGLFGSSLIQKTMGWVSRSHTGRQAKLGEKNKFYYDQKLKRWVEEGAEPPAEEAAPPPPPTAPSFQNGIPGYNINNALKNQSLPSDGGSEVTPPVSSQHNSGIPPMPPSQNQFSARGRMGVRSRYVDTFNKGGTVASSFQSPMAPSVKPPNAANFFVPTSVPSNESIGETTESNQDASSNEDASSTVVKDTSFSTFSSPSSSSHSMQRFPSMDNIHPLKNNIREGFQGGTDSLATRTRAASWSGSLSDQSHRKMGSNHLAGQFGTSPLFSHAGPPPRHRLSGSSQSNVGNFGDDLQEVEL